MSDDLSARLRDAHSFMGDPLLKEAADEIERLLARTAELERKDASRCETGLPCERLTSMARALSDKGEKP